MTETPGKKFKEFDLYYFAWTNLLTLAVITILWRLLVPNFWHEQLANNWQTVLLTFIAAHLFFSFVEYFFHRYSLHANLLKIFNNFHNRHVLHHSHTEVFATEEKYINNFPITEEAQLEAAIFPWYAYLICLVLVTPVLLMAATLLLMFGCF